MKEELLAGMKNALARGFPLEKVAQSFINAGYTQAEVREAAQQITGVSGVITPLNPMGAPVIPQKGANAQPPPTSPPPVYKSATPLPAPLLTPSFSPSPSTPSGSAQVAPLPTQSNSPSAKQPSIGHSGLWKGMMIGLSIVIVLLIVALIAVMLYGEELLKYLK
jgi:hypothetical protein